jgi:hypothetical protein
MNRKKLAQLSTLVPFTPTDAPCKAIDTAADYCRTCRDYLTECRTAVIAMLDRLPYRAPDQAPHFRNRQLTRAEQLEHRTRLEALLTEAEARA